MNSPQPDLPTACAATRDLISLDADHALHDRSALDVHVAECADCRTYQGEVAALSRRTRLRSASHDTAFIARVMTTARPARLGRGGWLRPALLWCALLTTYYSVNPLFFGEAAGASTHVARHVGATSLALAIGFAIVVWKPNRAAGLLPFVASLACTMAVAGVLDMANGLTGGTAELVHASELIGMVLLWMIAGSPGWQRVSGMWAAVRATI